MRWVIIGCGFTGSTLARALRQEDLQVLATRRDTASLSELAALGVELRAVDIDAPFEDLFATEDLVVFSVPPRDAVDGERRVAAAAAAAGARRVVYLSSTGVYPPAGGAWVDESTKALPASPRGARRLRSETAFLEAASEHGLEAAALRIAGIYGPGRGVLARTRAGNYRIIGEGNTHVSRIHVDDLCQAIRVVGTAANLEHRVFNVADDDPETSAVVGDAAADWLHKSRPPRVSPDEVSQSVRAMLGANRRIDNARLKTLGWAPRYASWRAGMKALLTLGAGE